MKEELRYNEQEETLSLLGDKDFLITPASYDSSVNVTVRTPIMLNDQMISLEMTSSFNINRLKNLRLENFHGRFYVISDAGNKYDKPFRVCVESSKIGKALIRAMVLDYAEKQNKKYDIDATLKEQATLIAERHGLSKQLADYQELFVTYAPLIGIACGVTLTVSACSWLLF